jgi:uncharacterized LabA/DUF88 family protein
MERVFTYIDGFNLYYGMSEAFGKKYLWLDLVSLSNNLLTEKQQLNHVHYFTARIRNNNRKAKRQRTYLEALDTKSPSLETHYGKYLKSATECPLCHQIYQKSSEKMSDVNLATYLLVDAYQDNFDTAIIISGDSDLSTPVSMVKQLFPMKRIIFAFPPARSSIELINRADESFMIGKGLLAKSQFPDPVLSISNYPLQKPITWI